MIQKETKMRKIFIKVDTSTVGTKGYYFVIVEPDASNEYLEELVSEYARDNAEMYGIYAPDPHAAFMPSEDDDFDGETDDDIGGTWEEYDSDKHDDYTCSGNPDWINLT